MLAFVLPEESDSEDVMASVRLAYLLKDVKSTDKELSCDIFAQSPNDC